MRGVVNLRDLPDAALPEIAFAGRSNVGKSSLLNGLTFRKNLARSSNTPGRTRELNFFNLADRLMLVDLPGFGYARAARSDIARWTTLTRDYLRGRAALSRVFLLIDSRHGVKDNDLAVMDVLDESAVVYQLVLTKTDKLKRGELDRVYDKTSALIARRPAAFSRLAAVSAHKGDGMADLRADIAALCLT